MNENVDLTLVALGLLVFSAHLFASLYSRRMVPDVLFLILIGLLLGPIFHLITPTDLGVVGPVFVAVTLVVILFEGGTSLSLKVMQDSWKSTMKLTTTGFFASMIVVAVIAKYFLDFPWTQAFLLGSILGGTSSAVVIPLVKQLKIGEESRTVLVLESALTDVFCIVFALVFLEIYHSSHINIGLVFGQILGSFTFSGLIGIAGGLVWSRILEKVRKIQNSIFTTPAFVFIIYGITQVLGYSGAIAALTFGITMSNINTFQNRLITNLIGPVGHELNETEKVFFSEIVFLFKTFFFVYIGISIMFDNINAIYCGLIITGILLLSRLFIAYFCSPDKAKSYDKTVISSMIPKGLAAAVLATIPEQAGIPEGAMIKNITFSVILFSIVLTAAIIILSDKSKGLQNAYAWFFKQQTKSKHKHPQHKDSHNS